MTPQYKAGDTMTPEQLRAEFERETGMPAPAIIWNDYAKWLEADNIRLRTRLIEAEKEKAELRGRVIDECVETLRQSHHLVCSCDGNGCPRIAHITAKFESLKQNVVASSEGFSNKRTHHA